jgi:hypothetical protein
MNFSFPRIICLTILVFFISVESGLVQETTPKPKSLVTTGEYCNFLNDVAARDVHHLYDEKMASEMLAAKILRLGVEGNYSYLFVGQDHTVPMTYVDLFSALRYCNWSEHQLFHTHNEEMTESGVYMLENDQLISIDVQATYHLASCGVAVAASAAGVATWIEPTLPIKNTASIVDSFSENHGVKSMDLFSRSNRISFSLMTASEAQALLTSSQGLSQEDKYWIGGGTAALFFIIVGGGVAYSKCGRGHESTTAMRESGSEIGSPRNPVDISDDATLHGEYGTISNLPHKNALHQKGNAIVLSLQQKIVATFQQTVASLNEKTRGAGETTALLSTGNQITDITNQFNAGARREPWGTSFLGCGESIERARSSCYQNLVIGADAVIEPFRPCYHWIAACYRRGVDEANRRVEATALATEKYLKEQTDANVRSEITTLLERPELSKDTSKRFNEVLKKYEALKDQQKVVRFLGNDIQIGNGVRLYAVEELLGLLAQSHTIHEKTSSLKENQQLTQGRDPIVNSHYLTGIEEVPARQALYVMNVFNSAASRFGTPPNHFEKMKETFDSTMSKNDEFLGNKKALFATAEFNNRHLYLGTREVTSYLGQMEAFASLDQGSFGQHVFTGDRTKANDMEKAAACFKSAAATLAQINADHGEELQFKQGCFPEIHRLDYTVKAKAESRQKRSSNETASQKSQAQQKLDALIKTYNKNVEDALKFYKKYF